MDIFMAPGAELWSGRKIHVLQSDLQRGRTVTIDARYPAVRAR